MGWDGMEWDGDGDGMEWDGDGNGMEWDGMGWDGMGSGVSSGVGVRERAGCITLFIPGSPTFGLKITSKVALSINSLLIFTSTGP